MTTEYKHHTHPRTGDRDSGGLVEVLVWRMAWPGTPPRHPPTRDIFHSTRRITFAVTAPTDTTSDVTIIGDLSNGDHVNRSTGTLHPAEADTLAATMTAELETIGYLMIVAPTTITVPRRGPTTPLDTWATRHIITAVDAVFLHRSPV